MESIRFIMLIILIVSIYNFMQLNQLYCSSRPLIDSKFPSN